MTTHTTGFGEFEYDPLRKRHPSWSHPRRVEYAINNEPVNHHYPWELNERGEETESVKKTAVNYVEDDNLEAFDSVAEAFFESHGAFVPREYHPTGEIWGPEVPYLVVITINKENFLSMKNAKGARVAIEIYQDVTEEPFPNHWYAYTLYCLKEQLGNALSFRTIPERSVTKEKDLFIWAGQWDPECKCSFGFQQLYNAVIVYVMKMEAENKKLNTTFECPLLSLNTSYHPAVRQRQRKIVSCAEFVKAKYLFNLDTAHSQSMAHAEKYRELVIENRKYISEQGGSGPLSRADLVAQLDLESDCIDKNN